MIATSPMIWVFLSVAVQTSAGKPAVTPVVGEEYLSWTATRAQQVGRTARVNGRIGGGQRLIHTERAFSYKLRATWLTRDVIQAAARLQQLSSGLTNQETAALVREAESAGDTVIMVEIDPNEGSGVIPLDWTARFGPKDSPSHGVFKARGASVPALRDVRGLAGVFRRDYDYELFWIVFPLKHETTPLFSESATEAELVVTIHGKEGRVSWPVPASVREQTRM